jgi:Golgi nucleoside diphosphatase
MTSSRFLKKVSWVSICFVFLICLASTVAGARSNTEYVAVVDAGSSGSRVYLYAVVPELQSAGVRDLMQFESDAPGLSGFTGNPADAGMKGLGSLFQRLEDFVEKKNIPKKEVKVFVLATGGMRMIDGASRQAILDSVSKYVEAREFSVQKVETISGENEGVYSWVDVNYLLRKFQNRQPTVGIIEIGGASAQITFEASDPHGKEGEVVNHGRKFNVFSESFSGLGRNEARKSMIELPGGVSGTVRNPCYPEGLTFDDQKARANGLTGDFNFSACTKNYEKILEKFEMESLRTRMKDGPKLYAAVGTGNPVGTFWGLLKAWKIQTSDPFMIVEQEKLNCDRSWTDFAAQFGNDAFNKTQCADSVFITTFLYGQDGLGLKNGFVRSYETINGRTPSWTRGFVVLEYSK